MCTRSGRLISPLREAETVVVGRRLWSSVRGAVARDPGASAAGKPHGDAVTREDEASDEDDDVAGSDAESALPATWKRAACLRPARELRSMLRDVYARSARAAATDGVKLQRARGGSHVCRLSIDQDRNAGTYIVNVFFFILLSFCGSRLAESKLEMPMSR